MISASDSPHNRYNYLLNHFERESDHKLMKRLFLSSLIISLGLSILPVQAQQTVSDTQVGALVEALRLAAPDTGTDNDGLYSDWQIKPDNIPRWSRLCTGQEITPAQFEDSPVTARGILVCVMRDVLAEEYQATNGDESLAVRRAAAWWMTGDPEQYNSPEIDEYLDNVVEYYQQQSSGGQSS